LDEIITECANDIRSFRQHFQRILLGALGTRSKLSDSVADVCEEVFVCVPVYMRCTDVFLPQAISRHFFGEKITDALMKLYKKRYLEDDALFAVLLLVIGALLYVTFYVVGSYGSP